MKYLFGYERGRVISEQNSINEDFMDVEPDVAEPETKPKQDQEQNPILIERKDHLLLEDLIETRDVYHTKTLTHTHKVKEEVVVI